VVEGQGDEAALIAALRGRLAGYKTPKRVVFVEALPRNAMGKVQKALLRRTYAGLFA
jgi:malonyl-CoA/methylmalonyl-CoA synthetase